MTQVQSIQQNIRYCKKQLNSFRLIKTNNELEEAHKQAAITETINEINELKVCLKLAVKQLS